MRTFTPPSPATPSLTLTMSSPTTGPTASRVRWGDQGQTRPPPLPPSRNFPLHRKPNKRRPCLQPTDRTDLSQRKTSASRCRVSDKHTPDRTQRRQHHPKRASSRTSGGEPSRGVPPRNPTGDPRAQRSEQSRGVSPRNPASDPPPRAQARARCRVPCPIPARGTNAGMPPSTSEISNLKFQITTVVSHFSVGARRITS